MFLAFIIGLFLFGFIRFAWICHKAKKEIEAFDKARQEYRTYWARRGIKTKGYYCPPHIAANRKFLNV